MTVNTLNSSAEFVTNGVTTVFPIGFKFLRAADLKVSYTNEAGVTTDLVLGTDYTVSGAGDEDGGSITAATALATGQLGVERDMLAYQETSLRNQGRFFAETHEQVFDRLTMLIQQLFGRFGRALLRPLGREFYDAEGRQIKRLQDPTDAQDAATRAWSQAYVSGVLATGQGPLNNAANVAYSYPDSTVKNVQSLSSEDGAFGVGYGAGSVGASLDSLTASLDSLTARISYKEAFSAGGVLSINAATAATFGINLLENITSIVLTGATLGSRVEVDLYFRQPESGQGKTVSLPSQIIYPSGVTDGVSTTLAATTMIRLVSIDGGSTWYLDSRIVYFGVAEYELPAIATENSTFNDEGTSVSGWVASNAALTTSSSYLRQTKQAGGSNSSMAKSISFTPTNADFILYGKARVKSDASTTAVIWLLNGTKEISIWFGSANGGDVATQGAISIRGTTGESTRNVVQVASGVNYEATAVDFALQYDHKFSTLTCWFREADGRWKFQGRVACNWFAAPEIQALTTTASPVGAWIEFDYLTLARPNIALLSDSIGEGKTLFSPNPSLGLTNDESTWMRHANIYPALRNNLVVNKGVGGNTSAQMLARLADVTGTGAKVVFYHISSNDEAAGVSQADRTAIVQSTVNGMKSAGQSVVALNSVYATQLSPDNTPPRSLMTYARKWWNEDRYAITGVSAFIDLMAALKTPESDYMDPAKTQPDGIHPNIPGHAADGALIVSYQ